MQQEVDSEGVTSNEPDVDTEVFTEANTSAATEPG